MILQTEIDLYLKSSLFSFIGLSRPAVALTPGEFTAEVHTVPGCLSAAADLKARPFAHTLSSLRATRPLRTFLFF